MTIFFRLSTKLFHENLVTSPDELNALTPSLLLLLLLLKQTSDIHIFLPTVAQKHFVFGGSEFSRSE
jgi:hypothetical protein